MISWHGTYLDPPWALLPLEPRVRCAGPRATTATSRSTAKTSSPVSSVNPTTESTAAAPKEDRGQARSPLQALRIQRRSPRSLLLHLHVNQGQRGGQDQSQQKWIESMGKTVADHANAKRGCDIETYTNEAVTGMPRPLPSQEHSALRCSSCILATTGALPSCTTAIAITTAPLEALASARRSSRARLSSGN